MQEPGRYRDHVLRYQTNLIHDLPPRYSTLLKEELVQNAHDLSSWHEAYRAVRVLAALRGKVRELFRISSSASHQLTLPAR
jgi:hypothetical protein